MQACQQPVYPISLVVLERLSSVSADDPCSRNCCRSSSKYKPRVTTAVFGRMCHYRSLSEVTWVYSVSCKGSVPLLLLVAILSFSTYVTGVLLQQRPGDSMVHSQNVRNRLRQNVKLFRANRPYFGQILENRFTLHMTTDVEDFIAVGESVLSMRALLSGTISEVVQS
jgi:hypothetical protein